MLKLALTVAIAVSLAACGGEQQADSPAPPPKAQAAPGVKSRIDELAPGARDAAFLRAIRDAGQECQQVVGSAYAGDHFGRPSWVARCRDGVDWLVMIQADGSALVARREEKPVTSAGRT